MRQKLRDRLWRSVDQRGKKPAQLRFGQWCVCTEHREGATLENLTVEMPVDLGFKPATFCAQYNKFDALCWGCSVTVLSQGAVRLGRGQRRHKQRANPARQIIPFGCLIAKVYSLIGSGCAGAAVV